jgi:hypothetical protein
LEDWFFPDDDRATYAEGLTRGGFLVSFSVEREHYETAHAILDDEGTINLDDRADVWSSEGWDANISISEFRQLKSDPASTIANADRIQQTEDATDDAFAADPTDTNPGVGSSHAPREHALAGSVRTIWILSFPTA